VLHGVQGVVTRADEPQGSAMATDIKAAKVSLAKVARVGGGSVKRTVMVA
jgi:hypothetical protein